MNDAPDTILVDAALAGDADAFGLLVRRHQELAHAVALGVVADFALAMDATQEAFLCAYFHLPRLRDRGRFAAWLCGIARNTAFELLRDRQRQERLARSAAAAGVTASAESPPADDAADEAEQRRLVQQALARLPEKDREALVMHYADGLRYGDICDCLGISAGTLKGRLQRGRTALREELAMVREVCRDNAPDEAFAHRLKEAVHALGAAGPASHHIPSPWLKSVIGQINSLARSGDEGYRVAVALSHSGTARARYYVVTAFGLRREGQTLGDLERMLEDRSARVRRQALRWYASRIHPGPDVTGPHAAGQLSGEAPAALDHVVRCLGDGNHNVRFVAVGVLSAYAKSGHARVADALRRALDDPKHKVRHAAARALAVPCPGCGDRA